MSKAQQLYLLVSPFFPFFIISIVVLGVEPHSSFYWNPAVFAALLIGISYSSARLKRLQPSSRLPIRILWAASVPVQVLLVLACSVDLAHAADSRDGARRLDPLLIDADFARASTQFEKLGNAVLDAGEKCVVDFDNVAREFSASRTGAP